MFKNTVRQTNYPVISVYCLATGTYTGIKWHKENIYRHFCGNTFSASEFSNIKAPRLRHFFSFLSLAKVFLLTMRFFYLLICNNNTTLNANKSFLSNEEMRNPTHFLLTMKCKLHTGEEEKKPTNKPSTFFKSP